MTNNQIRYQEHLERQRANRKNEQLTERRDLVTASHYERSDSEAQRSNLARELENNRHNLADEQLRQYQAQMGISQREQELRLAQSRLAADIEHNSEVRDESRRSNLVRESETERSNRAKESQLQADLRQRYAALVTGSADKAFPGLGLFPSIVATFESMGSGITQAKLNRDLKNVVSRRHYVGG